MSRCGASFAGRSATREVRPDRLLDPFKPLLTDAWEDRQAQATFRMPLCDGEVALSISEPIVGAGQVHRRRIMAAAGDAVGGQMGGHVLWTLCADDEEMPHRLAAVW